MLDNKRDFKINDRDLFSSNIYIIGSSELGPTNVPTPINSEKKLYSTFGQSGNLVAAYKKIKESSLASNIILVKTTGTHAEAKIKVNSLDNGLILKAKASSKIYNNIKISIDTEGLTFEFPSELGGKSRRYTFSDYPIFDLLEKAINYDTENNLNYVYAKLNVYPGNLTMDSMNVSELYMYGGDDGLNISKNDLYNCLETTYKLLEGEKVDLIVPLEAFMDDISPKNFGNDQTQYNSIFYKDSRDYLNLKLNDSNNATFYEQLLNYCLKQMNLGFTTHGIMGYNNISEFEAFDEDSYISSVLSLSLKINRLNLSLKPYWFLISVVAGDLKFSNKEISNGYLTYAGTVANSCLRSNITNKTIDKNLSLYNEFSDNNKAILSDMGIVVFKYNVLKNACVIMNSVTTSDKINNLHLLYNVRIFELTYSHIKKLLDSYVGKNIKNLVENNALIDRISKTLSLLVNKNILSEFKIKVDLISEEELKIYINLKTDYTLKPLTIIGSMKC
ncbi:hypothetical protein [Clostridium felsineum]|uniref:Uncharacterized protein n=1 Tax=Clostridium felsineum TaxID=36839 RepID=A0A1S8L1Y3_9CLOT|nr:hypothetical protein [Clostridium felsineum]URZ09260.1 hypothetical protein CLROS_046760 [Clostridium felsineum]URZ13946.1 hypothetical protein CROST_047240 [Clostridium felsineum]